MVRCSEISVFAGRIATSPPDPIVCKAARLCHKLRTIVSLKRAPTLRTPDMRA